MFVVSNALRLRTWKPTEYQDTAAEHTSSQVKASDASQEAEGDETMKKKPILSLLLAALL